MTSRMACCISLLPVIDESCPLPQTAFESAPELQQWICKTPDEATIAVFFDAAARLSGAGCVLCGVLYGAACN